MTPRGLPWHGPTSLALVPPTMTLHAAWLEARADWGPGVHEDGFGLWSSDEVDSPAGFTAWLARLAAESDPANVETGRMCSTYRWIVEDGRVLGGIAFRYGLEEFVQRFGHIGYGIRPSARGRGLASWALGRILDEARATGLDRVLIICEADNTPSMKTIERHGGVLEEIRHSEAGAVRRYWIDLGD
ncbi:GNAT family N-acetyltransferase [Saccharothrix isguenensis]